MTSRALRCCERDIDALVGSLMDRWDVPGVAMALVKDGRVLHMQGYGYANIEREVPVTTDSLFAIGSLTKAFTATAAGILVQAGQLDLLRPVRSYLSGFALKQADSSRLATPRDLLCHCTGIPEHTLLWYRSGLPREELVSRLRWLEPTCSLRERFQYQNLMYTAIGALIERIGGVPYERFVQEHIFTPLGMAASMFSGPNLSDLDLRSETAGYQKRGRTWRIMPHYDDSATLPQGGIYSTISDMAKWLTANLASPNSEDLPSTVGKAIRLCHKPQVAVSSDTLETNYNPGCYGMGWFVTSYADRIRLTHSGGIDGFSCLIDCLPQEACGLVVLTNRHAAPEPNSTVLAYTIVQTIYDMLLGIGPRAWQAKLETRRAKVAKERLAQAKAAANYKAVSQACMKEICGTYHNPAYGTAEVRDVDARPCIVYRGKAGPLCHDAKRKFRTTLFSLNADVLFSGADHRRATEMMWRFGGAATAMFHRT